MLDPMHPAWAATRDAVRHAFGLSPEGRAGADRSALRAAYRALADGVRSRRVEPALALLAPDFARYAQRPDGGPRVASRAEYAAWARGTVAAPDSVIAFGIDVSAVEVRGDSAVVHRVERTDAQRRPAQPRSNGPRAAEVTWWADHWVRTPRGWRASRFVEVREPHRPTRRP